MRAHDEERREHPPSRRRKNRRRWCRGVVGVEHKPRWVDLRAVKGVLVFKCEACGKELETVGPWRWSAKRRERYEQILAESGFSRGYHSIQWNRFVE